MEEAPRVRDATFELLGDVEPAPFRDRIERTLEGRPLTPGVLTVRTALAADGTVSVETAADRAAGVQLVYEGLRLTHQLVEDEPWPPAGDAEPDKDVVATEILVAKGIDQLAHTGVRERVVDIVRRFARIHSRDEADSVPGETDDAPAEPSLDSDFVVLAVAAGADLAVQTVPPGLVEYARELATDLESDPLGPPEALADVADDVERILAASEPTAEERSPSSTMDP